MTPSAWASASCTRRSPSASRSAWRRTCSCQPSAPVSSNFGRIYAETRKLLADFESHRYIDPRQKVRELAISQQQVIEIVKALSVNCKVIIFDEPTAALTEAETEVLFRIIGTLKKKGIGILYISHRLAEIYRIADMVTILRDGHSHRTVPVADIDQITLVNKMVGRISRTSSLRRPRPRKGPASPPSSRLKVFPDPASSRTCPSPSAGERSWAFPGLSAPAGPR